MLVELRLQQWIEAGLVLYRDNPLLVENVFYDTGQVGFPDGLASGLLHDSTKRWLPNEYAGGTVRYGSVVVPILGNTEQELSLDGDLSTVRDPDNLGYQVIPPAVAKLMTLLQEQSFTVSTAFPQIPTSMPAVTIRLESDVQGDTYIGENLESYMLQGVEVDANRASLTGSYLLSLWSVNRLETLWMYAWLANYTLRSIQAFAAWGLYDVSLRGSDLDPALQFMPEHTYVRHLMLTMTRDERAISTQQVPFVTSYQLDLHTYYQRFEATLPEPMGE